MIEVTLDGEVSVKVGSLQTLKALRVVPSRMDSVPFCLSHAATIFDGTEAAAGGAVHSLAEVPNSVAKLEKAAGDKGTPGTPVRSGGLSCSRPQGHDK